MSLECIAQYCLLEQELSQSYIPFFYATLSKKGEDLNPYISLKACFDIFMVYDILK